MGNEMVKTIIGIVILVVVSALIFPIVNTQVANLTDDGAGNANYVGDTASPLVAMIPVFYWLAVALVVIGAAVLAIKETG